jgi:hypothetical protein
MDVMIELLKGRGLDEGPPTDEEARCLWASDRLPAREGNQIGAFSHEAL